MKEARKTFGLDKHSICREILAGKMRFGGSEHPRC
jgi:hypothetical protein